MPWKRFKLELCLVVLLLLMTLLVCGTIWHANRLSRSTPHIEGTVNNPSDALSRTLNSSSTLLHTTIPPLSSSTASTSLASPSSTTPAPNLSGLELSVDAGVIPIITDPTGKRTGLYLASGVILREIRDSGFFEDDTGRGITNVIDINNPASGTYTLTLAGARTARYHLSVDITDVTGVPESRLQASGTIQQGSRVPYILQVALDGNGSSSMSTTTL